MNQSDELPRTKLRKEEAKSNADISTYLRLQRAFGFNKLKNVQEMELAIRDKIIERQRRIEAAEIRPQTWCIVFGDEKPKFRKDIFQINHVTTRNVWMEELFFYNKLVLMKPNETFHKPSKYTLKFQPPRSPFRLLIPLDDPQIQENMIILMSKWSEEMQAKILFYFSPTDPTESLFARKVNPITVASYRTKNEVLKKICESFVDGKISLDDLTQTLNCDYEIWRRTLYNLLTDEEQLYHAYLLDKNEPDISLERMAEKYQNDVISLAEYEDFKFPERAQLRDIEALEYPRPYEMKNCIICHSVKTATIKCQNCPNMVCKSCIESKFLNENGKVGSFLYLHRLFCMKRGSALNLRLNPIKEPSYLIGLRDNGRIAIVNKVTAEAAERERLNFFEIQDIEDDGYDSEEERRKRRLQEENKRIPIDTDLYHIMVGISLLAKDFRNIKRDVLSAQRDIDRRKLKPRSAFVNEHDESKYFYRLNTLKSYEMSRMINQVQKPLQQWKIDFDSLHITVESTDPIAYHGVMKEINVMLKCIDLLIDMENIDEFYTELDRMQKQELEALDVIKRQKISDTLLKFS